MRSSTARPGSRRALQRRHRLPAGLWGVVWLLAAPLASAGEGLQLASEQGCLNCHGPQSHTAPTLAQLTDKLVKRGDSPEVLDDRLKELRGQSAIHSHQMVSDESLRAILKWMAQGAK